ncbi:MAG: integrase core domain-containing protein [Solidesulfovibrio sp. DCME]|uniref:integrase core domain-containing protein n=1 Tax=Solidesulfovibrio sp. DCME TaxID=3447380 RepID=UPI003D0B1E7E
MDLIGPGNPWQSEGLNSKIRDECLSMELFRLQVESKVVIKDWRRLYSGVRLHSSL